MYLNICDLAQREGKKLNTKVNELLNLGIGKSIQIDEMLRALLLNMEERTSAEA